MTRSEQLDGITGVILKLMQREVEKIAAEESAKAVAEVQRRIRESALNLAASAVRFAEAEVARDRIVITIRMPLEGEK